ncbi:dipeptide ABC transporter ATP-binding protein [Cellulomonas palmilytica]|uniref:dipeptide ABC transporter ATP-binding protein n=1 Tax=Cellulomonas palmilytica TaxID=2608402 RepID=UPI001F22250A|nr:ABC transporter ATP-binding protein [Cellulomonas palmilytica]UJP40048.1 ABC transporter ATP-binding protein [Cellulomonas palmilytica]
MSTQTLATTTVADGPRPTTRPVLDVRGLRVTYEGSAGDVDAVRGVDLHVLPGEVVALVGESGSGKSTTAHAVVGLLPETGRVTAGSVELGADERTSLDLATLPARAWPRVRGARIGLVPQDPGVALNPVQRIGDQVAEVLRIHGRAGRRDARERAVEVLASVGIDEPRARARQHPHELSGGMRQRVLIGIALACEPELVVADEPTSALDVTVQRRVLDLLADLTARAGTAVLLITHDLAVAADRAERVVVMKDGEVVESGPTAQVLGDPQHPYTRELLAAAPGLRAPDEAARVPVTTSPRQAAADAATDDLLVVEHLRKTFHVGGRRSGVDVRAVDDVSFSAPRGSAFVLVGESGSGKSTTARLVLDLERADGGSVRFDGAEVAGARGEALRTLRRRTQLVHQNPYASLDPRFTVAQVVDEPLRAHRVGTPAERRARVAELLDLVRLPADAARRRPGELSGGQRQRVAIARALALDPDLLVLDEPTSALDVSVQARVLSLLADLRAERALTYLFISHDLAVVRQVADVVGVMSAGRLVETGPVDQVFDHPQDPYTVELVGAIPGRAAAATPATREAHR